MSDCRCNCEPRTRRLPCGSRQGKPTGCVRLPATRSTRYAAPCSLLPTAAQCQRPNKPRGKLFSARRPVPTASPGAINAGLTWYVIGELSGSARRQCLNTRKYPARFRFLVAAPTRLAPSLWDHSRHQSRPTCRSHCVGVIPSHTSRATRTAPSCIEPCPIPGDPLRPIASTESSWSSHRDPAEHHHGGRGERGEPSERQQQGAGLIEA